MTKITVIALVSLTFAVNAFSRQKAYEAFEIIEESQGRIVLSYRLRPSFDVSDIEEKMKSEFPYFSREPGRPVLPLEYCLLGIPGDADIELQWAVEQSAMVEEVDLSVYEEEEDWRFRSLETSKGAGRSAVEISDTGWIRNQRIAAVIIRPLEYDADTRNLHVKKRIRIRISFDGAICNKKDKAPPAGAAYEELLSGLLLNYESSRNRRSLFSPSPTTSQPFSYAEGGPWFKIKNDNEPAVYRIGTQLDLAGLDYRTFRVLNEGEHVPVRLVGTGDGIFDPDDYFEFYSEPFRSADGSHDRYTVENVYWFHYGDEGGRRIKPVDASPGSAALSPHFRDAVRYEENRIPSWAEDKWMWKEFRAGEAGIVEIDIPSPDVDSEDTADLSVQLIGVTDAEGAAPDHHMLVYINDQLICEREWDGWETQLCEIELSHDFLLEGTNELRVVMPGDTEAGEFDYVWLNWIKLEYDRLYIAENDRLHFESPEIDDPQAFRCKITGFDTPHINIWDITDRNFLENIAVESSENGYSAEFEIELDAGVEFFAFTEATVVIPDVEEDALSTLQSPENQADYLIITHEQFMGDMAPLYDLEDLEDLQQSRGYSTRIVNVENIYDEFNYGIFNPTAIRSFLDYAYHNWNTPAPQYVLLVGDASWDYIGYLPEGTHINYVPSYTKQWYDGHGNPNFKRLMKINGRQKSDFNNITGPYDFIYGAAMVDQQYVCVSGNDSFPDMMIGRFSVKNSQDLDTMVRKSLKRGGGLPPGYWIRNTVFITGGVNDLEQNTFGVQADTLIDEFIRPGFSGLKPYRIYKETNGYDWGYYEQDVIDAFNQGALFVSFFGHAGSWSWECMLDFDDIPAIQNNNMLPFVLSMTCNTVRFANPVVDSFGEEMVHTSPQSGALALWGGCNFGGLWSDYYLAYKFFDEVFVQKNHNIGSIINASKITTQSIYPDYAVIIEPYTLLGDPAMNLTFRSDPCLVMGGWFDKKVSWSQGGEILMTAFGTGLDGTAVETIELYYDGMPTGVNLFDDGNNFDFSGQDGFFGLYIPLESQTIPAGSYLFELKGFDYFNNPTALWPCLNVE